MEATAATVASSADGADGADGADDADDGREKIVDDAHARLKLGVARFFLAIHLGGAYEQPALWAQRLYPG